MKRRRNILISLTAALLSAGLVYGLYELQRIQVEQQETVAVLVPTRFISAGERLTEQDMEYKRMPHAAFQSEMIRNKSEALGKEAVIPLGFGEPILNWKVESYYLEPKRSESTFQVPKEYIRSISSGIRAGDRVLLYASGEGSPSKRVFDEAVRVASVKTSGNIEIDNVENPNLLSMANGNKEKMYASRREANGMIDLLNLNLSEAQWLQIDSLCKDGSLKLVIAYSPESLDLPVYEKGAKP